MCSLIFNKLVKIHMTQKKVIEKNNRELKGKFKTESPLSNGKMKSSNTSTEGKTTVIFMTLYRHFFYRK